MKTYSARPRDIEKKWYLIDAEDLVLGRMASLIAMRLMGKHKSIYTPNIDCGDYIVVINADKIKLTGRKVDDKRYYWHTGYPGGIKHRTAREILSSKNAGGVVRKAVQRMVGRNTLARQQLGKLYVYSGPDHPHAAQKPEIVDLAAMNSKNKRSA